jgi:hypothetical protein
MKGQDCGYSMSFTDVEAIPQRLGRVQFHMSPHRRAAHPGSTRSCPRGLAVTPPSLLAKRISAILSREQLFGRTKRLKEPVSRGAGALRRRMLDADRAMIDRFGDPFRPLEPECGVIQFAQPLAPSQLRRAGELIADRPDVELYVYGKASRDLGFLRYFETVRRLHLALYELDDISGFSYLQGGLRELVFGRTKKRLSLRFVETLPRLTRLFLVGHRNDFSSLRILDELTNLGLSGITLPDLSMILPLTGLRKLSILLGGTTNLALLPQLPDLEDLFLMRITKLSDLGVLGDLARLTTLRLDWMRNVTSLPSLAGLARLDNVELDTMKGLTDLSPLAAAPALRCLSIGVMPQLTAESLRCFIGHPRLEELRVHTGRRSVNEQVKRMFPLIAR